MSSARYSDLLVKNREIFIPHLYLAPAQAGAVLRWGRGAQAPPPNVGQAPQIFWFQQQKNTHC